MRAIPWARGASIAVAIVVAMFGMLLGAAPADAATASTGVDGSPTVTGYTGSGCSAPLHQCVDEMPTTNDGDYLYTNGPAAARFSFANLPGVVQVTDLTMTVRLRKSVGMSSCNASLDIMNGASSIASSPINNLTSTITSYTASATGLNLSSTTLDGLEAAIDVTCSGSIDSRLYWVKLDVTYIPAPPITGNARDTSGAAWGPCDGITPNVGVVVNGGSPTYVPCDDLTGVFASSSTWTANQTVTTYLNDDAAGRDGATYRRPSTSSATPITMDVDEGRVRLESGAQLTNASITVNDSTDDADIPVTGSAGAITVSGLLNVRAGADFAPGGTVTAPRFATAVGSTYTPGADTLVLTGSGTASCATALTARPWCHAGGMAGQPSVRYTGTGTTAIAGGVFANLQLQPAGGSPTYQLGTSDVSSLLVTTALTIGDGTNAVTADTSTLSSINDLGPLTVAAGATLGGSGAGTITVAAGLTGGGAINLTAGTVELRGSGNATLSATGAGSPWQFASLVLSNSDWFGRDITIPGTSRGIRASTLLQLGTSGDSANTTLVANAMTQPITVTGNVDITTRGVLTMPPSLVVHGNIVHSGNVNPGTSTLTLAGAGTTTLTTTGSGSIYDLTVATPGKVVEVASAGIWVSHLMTLSGTCAAPVTLRSSVPATSRSMTTSTMTTSTSFARVRDISTTTAISMAGTEDQGGNSNLTFTPPACVAPTAPFTHATDASTGSTRPTFIDGATAFHMSAANAMGTPADRVRTTVSSSLLDPSVRGLYALDGGSLADRSGLGATMTNNGGTNLANTRAGFGNVATFDGVDDFLSTPANAAYQTNDFTIETWFRATTLPAVQGILASRASGTFGTQQHAGIVLQGTGQINAFMINTAGTGFTVTAPAAPYLDGSWHHVALTVDASKVMTLYLDGAVAHTNTYTGTGNGAISAGWHFGGSNHFSSYFTGSLDDPQFTNRARTTAEIAGYVATNRPHAESIWTTPGADGQTVSCADGDRCADVTYAGPNIHRQGARYYATHQLRATASGFWSQPTTDWFETSDPAVSGIARDTTGAVWGPCDGVTTNIGIIVNGGAPTYVPCDDTTGAFSANVAFSAGQTVTTFLNDNAAGGDGATYRRPTVGSATPTSLDIDEGRVRLLAGGSWTNAQISIHDQVDDADIPVVVSFGNNVYSVLLQLDTGSTLSPGSGRTTTPRLRIEAGATLVSGDTYLTGNGTGCATPLTAQPLCALGTYVANASSLTMTAAGTSDVPGLAYYQLRVENGTYRLGSGTPIATFGRSVSVYRGILDLATYDPHITTMNMTADIDGDIVGGTSDIVISGNLDATGLLSLPNRTVRMRGAGSARLLVTDNADQIGTFEVSTSGAGHTVTNYSQNQSITFGTVIVGRSGDAGPSTFDATILRYAWNAVTIGSLLHVTDLGEFRAPPTMIMEGDLRNDNRFVPNTGTVRFSGPGTSTLTTGASAVGSFHQLQVVNGRTLELGADVTVASSLGMSSTSCATPTRLQSNVPGVQRTVDNTGAAASIDRAILRDLAMVAPLPTINAGDDGNTTNVVYGGVGSCTAPGSLFAHPTDASTGSYQPTALNARSGVHMSFQNATGSPVDRYRSVIRSSPVGGTVAGTFPLDGDGTDTTTAGNTATAPSAPATPTWVPGGPNFGQAAAFDGIDDEIDVPAIPAYDSSSFTIEAWFRGTTIANAATPTIVSRGLSSTDQQFGIWFDRASGKLVGSSSRSGTAYSTSTPAGTWLDDTWHHVALTNNFGTLQLYLDGTQYGSVAGVGAVPYPASPIRIGASSLPDSNFAGMIDDVQFTRATLSALDISGYARTARPHGQAIWSSPGYATSNGDAMPTCATGTRCVDVTTGGANLHIDGARYWAYHQARTEEGLWSVAGGDYFGTGDSLNVSNPSTLALPSMTPGDDTTASFSATMGCTTPTGCTMFASSPSETAAMAHATSAASIPRITPASPALPGTWAEDDPLGMGITILSSTSGKSTVRWGTGIDFTDLAALNFVGPTRTPFELARRTTNGTETTSVGVRVNPSPSTPTGSYGGRLSLIAVANL